MITPYRTAITTLLLNSPPDASHAFTAAEYEVSNRVIRQPRKHEKAIGNDISGPGRKVKMPSRSKSPSWINAIFVSSMI